METIKRFEDLRVWQASRLLARELAAVINRASLNHEFDTYCKKVVTISKMLHQLHKYLRDN